MASSDKTGGIAMTKSFTYLFIVLLLAFAVSCGSDDTPDNPMYPNAAAKNIDSEMLEDAYEQISTVTGIMSLLVSRDGDLVSEEYSNGASADSMHDVRSVTKTVMSILTGIALEEGFIGSLNETIADYLTTVLDTIDAERGAITIYQLLTMSCGLEWNELNGGGEYSGWVNSDEHLAYVINKPFIHEPGNGFNYNTGAPHLLSAILTEATGMNTGKFMEQYLFEDMDIGFREWEEDGRGYFNGGAGLELTPYDMVKIGNMYLNGGVHNGIRIISQDWLDQSVYPHFSTGQWMPFSQNYGYYLWLGSAHGYDYYFANGYGGQFIVVVPELELVVTATCEWRYMGDQAGVNWNTIMDVIVNTIIPAVY